MSDLTEKLCMNEDFIEHHGDVRRGISNFNSERKNCMNNEAIPTMSVESLVNAMRKQGIDVSAPELIQMFFESDDFYSVNDGNTTRVYKHGSDDLLMVLEQHPGVGRKSD